MYICNEVANASVWVFNVSIIIGLGVQLELLAASYINIKWQLR